PTRPRDPDLSFGRLPLPTPPPLLPYATLFRSVFEAVHGSAPDIAGQNKANPLALLQSAVLMLQHIGEMDAARRVQNAIVKILARSEEHTSELQSRVDLVCRLLLENHTLSYPLQ